jgi:hypothetical protein
MPTLYLYRTFGLNLAINHPIEFLTEVNTQKPDCLIYLHGSTSLEKVSPQAKRSTSTSCEWISDKSEIIIRFHDPLNHGEVEFKLQSNGRQLEAWWTPNVSLHDVIRVCTSIMIGRILSALGKLALHANAVLIGDSCILLPAPSGAGKSSTTAALMKAGARLLSDDIVSVDIINNQFIAAHGFAQLRLWPDTASELLFDASSLKSVYERTALTGDKRYWDLAQQPDLFQPTDSPIKAIYLLGERTNNQMSAQLLPANLAIGSLLNQLYLGQPTQPALWAAPFKALAKLVQQVPVFNLQLSDGLHRLHSAHDFLLSHLRNNT